MFDAAPADASLRHRMDAFPFAQGLSPDGHRRLLDGLATKQLGAATHLLDRGTLCEALLLVERGSIRVYTTSPSGRGITLYKVHPGESCVLGTASVLRQVGYPAQAEVAEECTALAVPAPLFRDLFAGEPSLQRFVVDLFSDRLAHLMLLVDDVAFKKVDERLAHFILREAARDPVALYPIQMSHDEIASQLGTAREVVSRLLATFETDGLIRSERRLVRVKDVAGLRQRAGEDT